MDIVTHGLAGALVARAVRSRLPWPGVVAAVGGGLAPDLDVVARFWDPMATITVHRTLTHSVVGGLLVAGVIAAVTDLGVPVPIVIRMKGTNVEEGKRMLAESGLNFTTADTMGEAADKVVALAGGR